MLNTILLSITYGVVSHPLRHGFSTVESQRKITKREKWRSSERWLACICIEKPIVAEVLGKHSVHRTKLTLTLLHVKKPPIAVQFTTFYSLSLLFLSHHFSRFEFDTRCVRVDVCRRRRVRVCELLRCIQVAVEFYVWSLLLTFSQIRSFSLARPSVWVWGFFHTHRRVSLFRSFVSSIWKTSTYMTYVFVLRWARRSVENRHSNRTDV